MNELILSKRAAASKPTAPLLNVGGFTPLTLTDYPGHLAAVVFCQGCSWQCSYCHNQHLRPRRTGAMVKWPEVRAFLARRHGLLDAVVFSGGEPTLQRGLLEAIRDVRAMGFKVALHTAGAIPARLQRLLPLLDWVGMDIKTGFSQYAGITGVPGSGSAAMESAQLVLDSGIEHEFRTTVHDSLVSRDQILSLAQCLSSMGAKHYVLQEFRATGCDQPALTVPGAAGQIDEALCASLRPLFETFQVRRA
jgi:anaerobic ribonucleoside-triphosphate reductase activating protein